MRSETRYTKCATKNCGATIRVKFAKMHGGRVCAVKYVCPKCRKFHVLKYRDSSSGPGKGNKVLTAVRCFPYHDPGIMILAMKMVRPMELYTKLGEGVGIGQSNRIGKSVEL